MGCLVLLAQRTNHLIIVEHFLSFARHSRITLDDQSIGRLISSGNPNIGNEMSRCESSVFLLSLLVRATRRKSRAFNNKLLTTYVTRDPFLATVDSQLTRALNGSAIKSSTGKRWQQQQIHNKRQETTEVVVYIVLYSCRLCFKL